MYVNEDILNMKLKGFDWDDGNRLKNEAKHGITCELVERFFMGEVWVGSDLKHSRVEERYVALGKAPTGRYLAVVFTFRERKGEQLLRPINARYMNRREIKKYEEILAKTKK